MLSSFSEQDTVIKAFNYASVKAIIKNQVIEFYLSETNAGEQTHKTR